MMFNTMDNSTLCHYVYKTNDIEFSQYQDFEKIISIWQSDNYKKRSILRLKKLVLDLENFSLIPLNYIIELEGKIAIHIEDFNRFFKELNTVSENSDIYLNLKIERINSFLENHKNVVKKEFSQFILDRVSFNSSITSHQTIQKIKSLIESRSNKDFKHLNLITTLIKNDEMLENKENKYFSLYHFYYLLNSSELSIACLKSLEEGAKACFPIYKIASPVILVVIKKIISKISHMFYPS